MSSSSGGGVLEPEVGGEPWAGWPQAETGREWPEAQ